MIMSVHADQNILFYSVPSQSLSRQVIGYNDEIIDTVFLSSSDADSHVAVAANSSLIRVYSIAEYDARLLAGHSNIVLCLDRSSSGRYLASGSKDKTARIWSFIDEQKTWSCVGVCEGHAESVGAVALSRQTPTEGDVDSPSLMFTGSQDCTIKLWDLSSLSSSSNTTAKCKSLATVKAHDKDINALDVSPNNLYLASASQDRTAKVYEIQYSSSSSGSKGEIKLLGVCKGHKRGVWTARFGTTERILATGSGDKTIKLWNLDDYSCVKVRANCRHMGSCVDPFPQTFESHTNSVLQIRFLNRDMQLASSASDGLLKLWNVRTDECVATMDNHTDKVSACCDSFTPIRAEDAVGLGARSWHG
jgi:U3 small nucleolar RNA-associated protein 13